MPTLGDIADCLVQFAPPELAEEWDNVGLLVGDGSWDCRRVMTCLTITPGTVREAVSRQANLIVSHHPLPFQSLRALTPATTAGRLLLELVSARIGVYSPHTAFDSAAAGINEHLAIGLGLRDIRAIVPHATIAEAGSGRMGTVAEPLTLIELAMRLKHFLDIETIKLVGDDSQTISRVGIACGSGGSFLAEVIHQGGDCLVTGETNLHTCLEAEARGVGLVLAGHFASERFALLSLADYLGEQIPGIEVWASDTERDPLRTV